MIKIITGDCMQELKNLKNSFALLITSPPYNVGIDYGNYKDNLKTDEYITWLSDIFVAAANYLLPGGHICINIGNTGYQPYIPKKDLLVCSLMQRWNLQYRGEIIWNKGNATANTAWGSYLSPNQPNIRELHEYIIIFRKSGKRYGKTDLTKDEFIEFTRSIWNLTPETCSEHPAPYPLSLVSRLIKLYSFEEETIFDPFCGSGTTLLAAKQLNRAGLGIELNPEYVKITETRLSTSSSVTNIQNNIKEIIYPSLFD